MIYRPWRDSLGFLFECFVFIHGIHWKRANCGYLSKWMYRFTCVIISFLSIGTETDFSDMQPCTLCNMPACLHSTLLFSPPRLVFNRAFYQSDCRSLASVTRHWSYKQTNKQINNDGFPRKLFTMHVLQYTVFLLSQSVM